MRTSVLGARYTHIQHEEILFERLVDENQAENSENQGENQVDQQTREQRQQQQQSYEDVVRVTQYEPCTIQGFNLLLPIDSLLHPSIMDSVLSVHTWRHVLNDAERSFLSQFLPHTGSSSSRSSQSVSSHSDSVKNQGEKTENENNISATAATTTTTATAVTSTTDTTANTVTEAAAVVEQQLKQQEKRLIDLRSDSNVRKLLTCQNFHFGNDKVKLIERLLSGYYHPLVNDERNRVRYLERQEHEIDMCLYSKLIEEKLQREKMEQLGEVMMGDDDMMTTTTTMSMTNRMSDDDDEEDDGDYEDEEDAMNGENGENDGDDCDDEDGEINGGSVSGEYGDEEEYSGDGNGYNEMYHHHQMPQHYGQFDDNE